MIQKNIFHRDIPVGNWYFCSSK